MYVLVYTWVHILLSCVVFTLHDECVACYFLWKWMDVNMNTIYYGFIRPVVRVIMSAWYVYARSSEYRHERDLRAGSGKYLYNFGPAGRFRGSQRWPSGRQLYVCKKTDPRARSAGPTRGSAEKNSRVMVTRPASDPYLTGHDPTRPVTFRTPPDPTRPDPRHFETLLTRPAGRVMTREKPC